MVYYEFARHWLISYQHESKFRLNPFRVGDFYETFGKDAIKPSKILGITLTKRSNEMLPL